MLGQRFAQIVVRRLERIRVRAQESYSTSVVRLQEFEVGNRISSQRCYVLTLLSFTISLTREQMFTSVGYRTPTDQQIILGATKSGKLTAISHSSTVQTPVFNDYPTPIGQLTPMLYSCSNLEVQHQYMRVNASTPTQMRAPGEAPGTFALESAMDELAYALDLDPVELRLRNYAEEKDPNSDRPWSSKHLKECYQIGAEKFGWSQRNPKSGSMQKNGFPCGWGMATAAYPIYQSPAAARVKIFADGRVVAQSGSHEIGTGTYTVMTQRRLSVFN